MKKTIILFAFAALMAAGHGQAATLEAAYTPDTILYYRQLRGTGFYYWDTNWIDWASQFSTITPRYWGEANDGVAVRRCYTDRPLKIIGIAAAEYRRGSFSEADSIYPDEYFQLYKPEGDSMTLLAEAAWTHTEPTHVMRFSTSSGIELIDIYSAYFAEPVIVQDSFYIGPTDHCSVKYHHGWRWISNKGIKVTYQTSRGEQNPPYYKWRWVHGNQAMPTDHPDYSDSSWHFHYEEGYPIVLAICDTAYVAGVDSAVLEHEVMIQPNPASDRMFVLSSLNIRSVQVFGMGGSLMYRRKVDSTSEEIDVSQWPRGIYAVSVETPAGVVTRKVAVQ